MKYIAAIPLAALLAVTAVPSAQAFGVGATAVPPVTFLNEGYLASDCVPHHACHGMMSGTAHPSCGSFTGGPSGGLF